MNETHWREDGAEGEAKAQDVRLVVAAMVIVYGLRRGEGQRLR